jgi:hypothetical protein
MSDDESMVKWVNENDKTNEYHNPAAFVGAIIGLNLNLHSGFNLTHRPFDCPPY